MRGGRAFIRRLIDLCYTARHKHVRGRNQVFDTDACDIGGGGVVYVNWRLGRSAMTIYQRESEARRLRGGHLSGAVDLWLCITDNSEKQLCIRDVVWSDEGSDTPHCAFLQFGQRILAFPLSTVRDSPLCPVSA